LYNLVIGERLIPIIKLPSYSIIQTMTPIFLTAEWRYLAMLNYEIDPTILHPLVPTGTELDDWNGRTFVSIVGFQFLNTRILGLSIPFHSNFEEVNLRFYVRYKGPEGWRRGVVFIKELVPRRAIATVARLAYNENYQALPMRHTIKSELVSGQQTIYVSYSWLWGKQWQGMQVQARGTPDPLVPGSEEEFITEHYWGYTSQRDGGTAEYQVEHPPWQVWTVNEVKFECNVARLYGEQYVKALQADPSSAFLADGSAVIVRRGQRIA
jgi:uncharacterized protein YqjF (DUF2071 family)